MKIKTRQENLPREKAYEDVYSFVMKLQDEGGKKSRARYEALDKVQNFLAEKIVDCRTKRGAL